VFSLGCVLFECLTRTPAFAGAHVAVVLAKILFDDPDVNDLGEGTPPRSIHLDTVTAGLLDGRRPGERD
jgi:hypothetical protein